MAVTLANRSIGAVAIPYDYVYDNMLNDFNSDAGFMVALFHGLDLRLGAGSLIRGGLLVIWVPQLWHR